MLRVNEKEVSFQAGMTLADLVLELASLNHLDIFLLEPGREESHENIE